MNLSHYPLSNVGCNDANKVNKNLLDIKKRLTANKYFLSHYATLEAALYDIGSAEADLVIDTTANLTKNTTIPTTTNISDVTNAGKFTGSYTLSIARMTADPLHQIFDGPTVSFTAGAKSIRRPEWWGTNTTPGTTDMTDATQAAVTSMQPYTKLLVTNNYLIRGIDIIDKTNIRITGGGKFTISGAYAEVSGDMTDGYAIQWRGTLTDVEIDHISIIGDGDATNNHQAMTCFSGQTITRMKIYDNYIFNCYLGIALNANISGTITDCEVYNNKIKDIKGSTPGSGYGILLAKATFTHVHHNTLDGCQRHSIYQGSGANVQNIIESNIIKNHRNIDYDGSVRSALSCSRSTGVKIINNEFRDCYDSCLMVDQVTSDSSNCHEIEVSGNIFINRKNVAPYIFIGEQLPPTTATVKYVEIHGNRFYTDHTAAFGGADVQIVNGQYIDYFKNTHVALNVASGVTFVSLGDDSHINNIEDCQYIFINNNKFFAFGSDTSAVNGVSVCDELVDSTFKSYNEILNNRFVGCGNANVYTAVSRTNPNLILDQLDAVIFAPYTDGDTTPSVKNANQINIGSTAPTIITDLDDGQAYQEISLYFNDAYHTLSNSMFLSDSLPFYPSAGDMIKLRSNGTNWYEIARSLNNSSIRINNIGLKPRWFKFTKTHTDLQAAALTNNIELFELPAGCCIHAVLIQPTEQFTGTGITDYKVSVGVASALEKYASLYDVDVSPSATEFQFTQVAGIEHLSSEISIKLAAQSVGANLDQSTAGAVQVQVLLSRLTTVTTV